VGGEAEDGQQSLSPTLTRLAQWCQKRHLEVSRNTSAWDGAMGTICSTALPRTVP
jgi:hypothetical protein